MLITNIFIAAMCLSSTIDLVEINYNNTNCTSIESIKIKTASCSTHAKKCCDNMRNLNYDLNVCHLKNKNTSLFISCLEESQNGSLIVYDFFYVIGMLFVVSIPLVMLAVCIYKYDVIHTVERRKYTKINN